MRNLVFMSVNQEVHLGFLVLSYAPGEARYEDGGFIFVARGNKGDLK